ncbi:hypothetical protein FIV00_21410 [Labrenzia sp. THAF82]|nr:hypothetical protein FIV00_21410 [Labrenzia sp. THAF82]
MQGFPTFTLQPHSLVTLIAHFWSGSERDIYSPPAPAALSQLIATRFDWVCAVLLHLAVISFLTGAGYWPHQQTSGQETVEVELVRASVIARKSLDDASLPRGRDLTGEANVGVPEAPRAEPVDPLVKSWISAKSFLAADVLKDPRSQQARVALASLTGADEHEQVCALEAMEQLRQDRPDFRPTRLAPHAFRNGFSKGSTLHVTAGAIRSNRVWYEIAYRCRLEPGSQKIVGFEYALGAEIARTLWDEHGLAPVH